MSKTKIIKKSENKQKPKLSTRIITKYLKSRGIDLVLQECGNNLRAFNAHLRRVCNLDRSVSFSAILLLI